MTIESVLDAERVTRVNPRTGNQLKNKVNVYRENVLEGAKTAFQRQCFDPVCKLSVKFAEEDGFDLGGPSREFLRLAIEQTRTQPIWSEKEDGLILILNSSCK